MRYAALCGSLSCGNYVVGGQMKLTVGAYLSQLVFCKPHKTQYVYITHQINQRDGAKPCQKGDNVCGGGRRGSSARSTVEYKKHLLQVVCCSRNIRRMDAPSWRPCLFSYWWLGLGSLQVSFLFLLLLLRVTRGRRR